MGKWRQDLRTKLLQVSLAASLSSRKIRNQNSKNRELYYQGHMNRAGVGDVGPAPGAWG